jgi:hypothetical protein
MTTPEPVRPWWLPAPVRLHAAWWIAVAVTLLALEYVTGLYRQFPLVYVIPVSLAAWYSGRWPALAFAVVVPVAHLVFAAPDASRDEFAALAATGAFRSTIVLFMALWFARLSEHERALHREVQALKGLLPICSFCKSIRNEAGEWEHLERFISRRSETQFSHGVCPQCQKTYYP